MVKRATDPFAKILALTAVSTILLLLTTFSVPFNKSVHLFRFGALVNGTWRYVDFGVFGYCPVPLGGVKQLDKYTNCTKPVVGWETGKDVADVLQVQTTVQTGLPKSLSSLLILGPVALVLTSIVFLVSLTIYASRTTARRAANGTPISPDNPRQFKLAHSVSQIALACATLTLVVNIIILLRITTHHVPSLNSKNPNMKSSLGSVVWLDGVAWLLLLWTTLFANRSRRAAIRSEAATESTSDEVEWYNTPSQPYYYVRPADNSFPTSPLPPPPFPPPRPRSPNRRGYSADDAPPPYTAAPSNTVEPSTIQDPLVSEGGRQFNFFRFGNNVSHV